MIVTTTTETSVTVTNVTNGAAFTLDGHFAAAALRIIARNAR